MTKLEPARWLTEDELSALFQLEQVGDIQQSEIRAVLAGSDSHALSPELVEEASETEGRGAVGRGPAAQDAVTQKGVEGEATPLRLADLTLPEKIKLAMFGNQTARGNLIRDASKLVQSFVLKNPRLQVREVEEFARNPNLSEHVLRAIGSNQSWMKSYSAKVNLVFNPKTPSDVSLKWVRYLNDPEIRKLAKSRNVPQVLVTVARRKLEETTR
jgi:hypothetical protein